MRYFSVFFLVDTSATGGRSAPPQNVPNKQKVHFSSSWWFQPIWKILVKLEIFPNFEGENRNGWNHHLVNLTVHNSLHHALLRGFQLCLVVAKLEGTQLHVWGNILSEFGFLNWGANTKELRQEVHGYMCCILFERLAATWEKNMGFSWIFKALVQWHQPNFPYTDNRFGDLQMPHSATWCQFNFWLVLFQWNVKIPKIRCCWWIFGLSHHDSCDSFHGLWYF